MITFIVVYVLGILTGWWITKSWYHTDFLIYKLRAQFLEEEIQALTAKQTPPPFDLK